jgi:hypothetical protein
MKTKSSSSPAAPAKQFSNQARVLLDVAYKVPKGFALAIFGKPPAEEASPAVVNPPRAERQIDAAARSPGSRAVYKCKGCGGRLGLRETTNYAPPVCPICGQVNSLLELVVASPEPA